MKKFYFMAIGSIVFLFAVIILLGFLSKDEISYERCEYYVVEKGDTLWDISERYTRGDKRKWIHEVSKLNHISDSGINAGQIIYVFYEQ
jgi:hypothetical protein